MEKRYFQFGERWESTGRKQWVFKVVSLKERSLMPKAADKAWATWKPQLGSWDLKPGPHFPTEGQGSWQEPTEKTTVVTRAGRALGSLTEVTVAQACHRNYHICQGLTTRASASVGTSGQSPDRVKDVLVFLWIPKIKCCPGSTSHSISWCYKNPLEM